MFQPGSMARAVRALVLGVPAALLTISPAGADELARAPTLTASVFASFGGTGAQEARWMLATDAAFLAGGGRHEDLVRLPASGLAFTRSAGLHPLVFGVPVVSMPSALGAAEGEGSGMTWVWVGAGVAVAAGLAQAVSGGGDDRDASAEGPEAQGSCDFSDNVQGPGGSTTVVDRECVP